MTALMPYHLICNFITATRQMKWTHGVVEAMRTRPKQGQALDVMRRFSKPIQKTCGAKALGGGGGGGGVRPVIAFLAVQSMYTHDTSELSWHSKQL